MSLWEFKIWKFNKSFEQNLKPNSRKRIGYESARNLGIQYTKLKKN